MKYVELSSEIAFTLGASLHINSHISIAFLPVLLIEIQEKKKIRTINFIFQALPRKNYILFHNPWNLFSILGIAF